MRGKCPEFWSANPRLPCLGIEGNHSWGSAFVRYSSLWLVAMNGLYQNPTPERVVSVLGFFFCQPLLADPVSS
jgi:hypothetical protein